MYKITIELDTNKLIAKQLLLGRTCDNCCWNFNNICSNIPPESIPEYYTENNKLLSKNNTCIRWDSKYV